MAIVAHTTTTILTTDKLKLNQFKLPSGNPLKLRITKNAETFLSNLLSFQCIFFKKQLLIFSFNNAMLLWLENDFLC